MLQVAMSKSTIRVNAPAKINLTLRVLGQRPDGYHELESVVAAVDLFDRMTIDPSDELALTCQGAGIPTGDDNLVMKAARLLQKETDTRQGAQISLEKSIPAGRGFGGGSSDAAATLVGLNALWRLDLSRPALAELGAKIGSDVPLFMGPPLSVMRGRGEQITPVPGRARWWVALAWPDHAQPTPAVYAAYDGLPQADAPRPAATEILHHLEASAAEAGAWLVNDLEPAYCRLRPEGPDLRTIFQAAGAKAVAMTGSGSAYFALADTEDQAWCLANTVRATGAEATVARVMDAGRTQGGDTR
jgi:4-diphosphocytidyl-2-C-methyl-D-erythritol kinase